MAPLSGKICLVTGASRGIGKGIAVQLGEAGATVYITGRSSASRGQVVGGTLKETADEITSRGGKGIAVICDHKKDDQVKSLFERIKKENGRLDVLVNNAYSAVNFIMRETKAKHKFWEYECEPAEAWDEVNRVGLRNHYICASYAAQMMVAAGSGLIVNVSSVGGLQYLFNVPYGVGKCAIDRMSADMGLELKKFNVACVTLWPGPVSTEEIATQMQVEREEGGNRLNKIFSNAETPEFSGKAVVALAADENALKKTGKVLIVADLANEYKFRDINGNQPGSLRQVSYMLKATGHTWLAALVPGFIKIPGFMMAAGASRL